MSSLRCTYVRRFQKMQILAIYQLLFCFSMVSTQNLMFPPVYYNRPCVDNNNCASGCCLLVEEVGRERIGICQSMGQFGHFCAPGDRLRDVGGAKMYTYSCPCYPGLECKPLWVKQVHGATVMQDPKCTPSELSPESPIISKFLYNEFPEVPIQ